MAINKLTLKFIWRDKRPRIANSILKEKNKVRGLTLFDLKIYYKATVIKSGIGERIDKQINGKQTENPVPDSHKYSQTDLGQRNKGNIWRKDSLFNKRCWND